MISSSKKQATVSVSWSFEIPIFRCFVKPRSVSETLKNYNDRKFYKSGNDKLIKNYGIGAQIIRSLNIKKMILVTSSKKKVIGLDGYGIRITKQELIWWKYL